MTEPNYEAILAEKVDYYGETQVAYQFAADEYAKQTLQSAFFNIGKEAVKVFSDLNDLAKDLGIIDEDNEKDCEGVYD